MNRENPNAGAVTLLHCRVVWWYRHFDRAVGWRHVTTFLAFAGPTVALDLAGALPEDVTLPVLAFSHGIAALLGWFGGWL